MSLSMHEGALFAGRYRVVRNIAFGAMSAVYEVIHVETERRRALKVMLPHLADDAGFRARFKRQARIAACVESDFLVEVFDAGIDDETGVPFLVMELLRGEELSQRIRRAGPLSLEEAILYLRQTASALDRMHAAAIVHRDLKPGNLFLAEREEGALQIKVLDFSVARLIADAAVGAATTTTLGAPLYTAPEQLRGEAISRAVDIFSLGMIAYTLLVGKAYWGDDAEASNSQLDFARIARHGPQEPACARAAREDARAAREEATLPPAFDAWFAKITAPDPNGRFLTAMTAVEALAAVFDIPPPSTVRPYLVPKVPPIGHETHALASVVSAAARSSVESDTFMAFQRRWRTPALVALLAATFGGIVAYSLLRGRVSQAPFEVKPTPAARSAPASTFAPSRVEPRAPERGLAAAVDPAVEAAAVPGVPTSSGTGRGPLDPAAASRGEPAGTMSRWATGVVPAPHGSRPASRRRGPVYTPD